MILIQRLQKLNGTPAILILAFLIVGLNSHASDGEDRPQSNSGAIRVKGTGYVPPLAPPVWGDVNRNRDVDLHDLVLLGKSWDNSVSLYGKEGAEVLTDLSEKWEGKVPISLHELDWENRIQIGTTSAFPEINKRLNSSEKSFFRAVGFGITYPESGAASPKSGLQVFNAPAEQIQHVRFQNLPGGIGFDDSESVTQRYDYPVESEDVSLEYMSSFAQELDFTGADLSVEAKYSMYSGSVKASTRSEFYKNSRSHKVIFKSTKSYGWFFLPDELIRTNLTTGFKNALGSINSRDVIEKYGQQYIYAEHRQGDLIIEVNFNTTTEKRRDTFGAQVNLAMGAPSSSLAIAAAIASLKENINEVTNLTVTLRRRGGPNLLEYIDPVSENPVSFATAIILDASDPQRLQMTIAAIAGAWAQALTADNAVASDFLSRPISDFYDTPSLPWTKETNLRAWFERFLRFQEQIDYLDGADGQPGVFDLDLNPPGLTSPFRHFRQAGPDNNNPVPSGSDGWEEHLWTRRELTAQRYPGLLEAGRRLYEAKESDDILAIFNPRIDERFRLPLLEIPQFQITVTNFRATPGSADSCSYNEVVATLGCVGANFTPQTDYEWRVFYNTGLPAFTAFGNPQDFQPTRPTAVFDGVNTNANWNYFPRVNNPPFDCGNSNFRNWLSAGQPGIIFGIVDTRTNNLISFRCLNTVNCGAASPAELLTN